MMAFFNLTHLGPQNLFKTAASADPSNGDRSKATLTISHKEGQPTAGNVEGILTSDVEGGNHLCLQQTSHTASYSLYKAATQHSGSHAKYTELLHKHQRSAKGPVDLYRQPVSTSQMYGWWMTRGEPQKQSWTQGSRHVHVNSEMTRFVDEMSKTNKEFTLY